MSTFRTESIGLAAFLAYQGYDHSVVLSDDDSTKALFAFDRDADGHLDREVADYETNAASASPKRLKQIEAELKRQMFAVLRATGGRK